MPGAKPLAGCEVPMSVSLYTYVEPWTSAARTCTLLSSSDFGLLKLQLSTIALIVWSRNKRLATKGTLALCSIISKHRQHDEPRCITFSLERTKLNYIWYWNRNRGRTWLYYLRRNIPNHGDYNRRNISDCQFRRNTPDQDWISCQRDNH